MNCRQCQDQLVPYVEGLLDDSSCQNMQAHMTECEVCRSELDGVRHLNDRLARDARDVPAVSMDSEVMNGINQRKADQLRRSQMIRRYRFIGTAAAAAAAVAAAVLIMSILDRTARPAYAFADTVQAYHAVRSIHLQLELGPPKAGRAECWAEFADNGQLLRLRSDWSASSDGPKIVAWEADRAAIWLKKKNFLIELKYPAAEIKPLEFLDPKVAVENLYRMETDGKATIEAVEPRGDEGPIRLHINHLDEPSRQDECLVDPASNLLLEMTWYKTEGEKRRLLARFTFLDHNEPIDPRVFKLEVPEDVVRLDWITSEIGLAQGSMTGQEVAVELARQFFAAMIGGDYATAGRLYAGIPAEVLERAYAQSRFVRIVAIGPANDDGTTERPRMVVPCRVELETDGKPVTKDFTLRIGPVAGQSDRWRINGGI